MLAARERGSNEHVLAGGVTNTVDDKLLHFKRGFTRDGDGRTTPASRCSWSRTTSGCALPPESPRSRPASSRRIARGRAPRTATPFPGSRRRARASERTSSDENPAHRREAYGALRRGRREADLRGRLLVVPRRLPVREPAADAAVGPREERGVGFRDAGMVRRRRSSSRGHCSATSPPARAALDLRLYLVRAGHRLGARWRPRPPRGAAPASVDPSGLRGPDGPSSHPAPLGGRTP